MVPVGTVTAAVWIVSAFAAGVLLCLWLLRGRHRDSVRQLPSVVDAVMKVAAERLSAHTAQASSDVASRHTAIDRELGAMRSELAKVTDLVSELERRRSVQYGELAGHIASASQQTAHLAESTRQLREALSSTKARGQWGERMAEDVLRLAGFVENVNYRKQVAVTAGEEPHRHIPDFTFLLPRGLQLHMDVKFPLDNYLRCLAADDDHGEARYRTAFLRDVRQRMKELAARDYQTDADSVDCLLMFIPNEQLYAFVHEHDARICDEALRHRIVLCSPLTLFAVLAVIRQAVDNFMLERTSDEILAHLGQFRLQWERYLEAVDKLGRRLAGAQRDFEELTTTRRRQLERPLDKLEELRQRRGIPRAGDELLESRPDGDGLAAASPSALEDD